MKITKIRALVVTAVSTVVLVSLTSGVAFGAEYYLDYLQYKYPGISRTYTCAVCHLNPAGGGEHNPYGDAIEAANKLNDYDIEKSIIQVEPLDSDGDTFTNKSELEQDYFPGDPNDHPPIGPSHPCDAIRADFASRYATAGTRLDTCATCHASASPTSGGDLNSYGAAVHAAGNSVSAVEQADSDGDTYANITEINARTFPGDASDYPPPVSHPCDSVRTSFASKYATAGTRLDTCTTCHASANPTSGGDLNSYGQAIYAAGDSVSAVEQADSDGDTYKNIDEINARYFPGDPNDFPPPPPSHPCDSIRGSFASRYATAGTRLDTCTTCHASANPTSGADLNSYGQAIYAAGDSVSAVEQADSDGDTYSNIDEINARTFPGNASDHPVPPSHPCNDIRATFASRYGTAGTRLDTCTTCHASANPTSGQDLNSYGAAIHAAGNSVSVVEQMDSDGDTYKNIDEINARTFPGNPNDFPTPTPPPPTPTPSQNLVGTLLTTVAGLLNSLLGGFFGRPLGL